MKKEFYMQKVKIRPMGNVGRNKKEKQKEHWKKLDKGGIMFLPYKKNQFYLCIPLTGGQCDGIRKSVRGKKLVDELMENPRKVLDIIKVKEDV